MISVVLNNGKVFGFYELNPHLHRFKKQNYFLVPSSLHINIFLIVDIEPRG